MNFIILDDDLFIRRNHRMTNLATSYLISRRDQLGGNHARVRTALRPDVT